MHKLKISFIAIILIGLLQSCSDSEFFNSYTKYDLDYAIDTAGTKWNTNSKRLETTNINWTNNNTTLRFQGADKDISILLSIDTKNSSLVGNDNLIKILDNDTSKWIADLRLKSYLGKKGGSHKVSLDFNRYFSVAMTTNTTTSTVKHPGTINLTIVE